MIALIKRTILVRFSLDCTSKAKNSLKSYLACYNIQKILPWGK